MSDKYTNVQICPFCNGTEFFCIEQDDPHGYRVMCKMCGGLGPLGVMRETSISAWNGAIKNESMTVQ